MSNYPGAVDDQTSLYNPFDTFSGKNLTTTLAVSCLSTDTTIQLSASPASIGVTSAYGIASIEDEFITYTGISGNNLTGCVRGQFGTTAIGHLSGVTVKWRFVSEFVKALQSAVEAVQTTLGVTGAFNFLAAQSSASPVPVMQDSYRVGIGASMLPNISGMPSNVPMGFIVRFPSPGAGGAAQILISTRGVSATDYTAVSLNDGLGQLMFGGADGTRYILGAEIIGATDGTVSTDNVPTRLVFLTSPGGANNRVERMRIGSNGIVYIEGNDGSGYGLYVQIGLSGTYLRVGPDRIDSNGTLFLNLNSTTDVRIGVGGGNTDASTSLSVAGGQKITGIVTSLGSPGSDSNIPTEKSVRTAISPGVNAQTGTSYTFADGDRGKLVTFTNASAIAATLPQAGARSNFISGWLCDIENRGTGALTITPTASTIDGASSLTLTQNEGCRLFSDGTNYFTQRGTGGSGNVVGPATSVTNDIPQFADTTGKLLKDGLGIVTTVGSPGSDSNIPTEKAVRTAIAGTSSSAIGCTAYNSAPLSGFAQSTWTVLTFDTNAYDTSSLHSTSSNTSRFTASQSGKWRFSVGGTLVTSFGVSSGPGFLIYGVKIKVNGSDIGYGGAGGRLYDIVGGQVGGDASTSIELHLTASDYVEVFVYHGGDSSNFVMGDEVSANGPSVSFSFIGT